jgi:hypothetical protein
MRKAFGRARIGEPKGLTRSVVRIWRASWTLSAQEFSNTVTRSTLRARRHLNIMILKAARRMKKDKTNFKMGVQSFQAHTSFTNDSI